MLLLEMLFIENLLTSKEDSVINNFNYVKLPPDGVGSEFTIPPIKLFIFSLIKTP